MQPEEEFNIPGWTDESIYRRYLDLEPLELRWEFIRRMDEYRSGWRMLTELTSLRDKSSLPVGKEITSARNHLSTSFALYSLRDPAFTRNPTGRDPVAEPYVNVFGELANAHDPLVRPVLERDPAQFEELARNARETGRVMAVISLSMPIDYQLQEIKRLALAEDDDEEVPVPNPRPTKLARYRADQVPLHLRAIDARETYGVSFYEISKQLVSERPTLSVTYGQPGQYRSNAPKRLYTAAKNAQTQLATGAMLITHAAND